LLGLVVNNIIWRWYKLGYYRSIFVHFDFRGWRDMFWWRNELGGNDQLLEYLVDDFPYIPPQDQDPYFYVNDGDDVWFMFLLC